MTHTIPANWLSRPVSIDLIGAGGNGSQMLSALARMHVSWRALGHPHGLTVRVFDPDTVTTANVGRQLFAMSDVGTPKAHVLVNRINAFWGIHWQAHAAEWNADGGADMLIGCVDSIRARRGIHHVFRRYSQCRYWLDLGNDATTAQVILGESGADKRTALPTVCDLFPELLRRKKEDNTPSCSLAGALARQDLFVNQHVVTWASTLLWRLLHKGGIDHHGYFINLESGRVVPLAIDRSAWERFGYTPWKPRPLKRIVKRLERRKGLFDADKVKLACGHVTKSNGKKRARCPKCKS